MDYNFFTSPATKRIFNQESYPALFYYQKRFNDDSLESTWSRIDLLSKICCSGIVSERHAYYKLKEQLETKSNSDNNESYKSKLRRESGLPWNTASSLAGWEFRNLIKDIYRKIIPPEVASPIKTLIEQLRETLLAIVSFNYDLSLESLKEIADDIYYPNFKGEDSNRIPVFKLHGSLNWLETSATQKINIANENDLTEIAQIEHASDCYCQPSVIAPTIFKQEINIDFQNDWRSLVYKNLWNMCWHKLKEADNLIFVGFGFPSTDWHIRALLESASTIRGYRNIIYCHKNNTNDGYDAVKNIFQGTNTRETNTHEFNSGLEHLVEKDMQCLISIVQ
jgi:hypothetical protein